MSKIDKEILEKIKEQKERVKTIVQNMQALKSSLESAQIPLKDFKAKKAVMEEELRGILQKIAKTKETHNIQPTIRGKTLPKEEISAESKIINREVLIADEAQELMYYFPTDFEGSITDAKVYLSITVDAHFVIGIDYEDYPQRPKLEIPPSILELNNNNEGEFYEKIPSYINWDPDNPKRIFELMTEIETVLVNMYSADIDSITKKSIQTKKLGELVEKANNALSIKDYDKAIEIIQSVIKLANELGEYNLVNKYTKNLNDVIALKSRDSYFY